MTTKCVLNTVRKLIRVNKQTTMAQVASYCDGKSKAEVLDILDHNRHLLIFGNGNKITGEKTQLNLRQQLWEEGVFWRNTRINYGVANALSFKKHEDLRKKLEAVYTFGGYGDSYTKKIVISSEYNEEALREGGLIPEEELELDDRLWDE